MKVLMINGSPHQSGCTYTALNEVGKALEADGIRTELVQLGSRPIQGCIDCGRCAKAGRCAFDDLVNVLLDKMEHSDGLIIGSPVYYAAPNGSLISLLNRMFFAGGSQFHHKPGAAVVSARRAGTTSALNVLNEYFTISQMPIVSSNYWNMVHGMSPEQVRQDAEGMQIMRTLGHNMAWTLHSLDAAKRAGVAQAPSEPRVWTNFIR